MGKRGGSAAGFRVSDLRGKRSLPIRPQPELAPELNFEPATIRLTVECSSNTLFLLCFLFCPSMRSDF